MNKISETHQWQVLYSQKGGSSGVDEPPADLRARRLLPKLYVQLQNEKLGQLRRVSKAIHKELGGGLTVLKIELDWLRKRLPPAQKELSEITDSMIGHLDHSIRRFQEINQQLTPCFSDDLGLIDSIGGLIDDLRKKTGIIFREDLPDRIDLDNDRSAFIFHLAEELLSNVIQHADATFAEIRLETNHNLVMFRVADNGRGLSPDELFDSKTFGLLGIKECIQSWGGELEIRTRPNAGSEITVWLLTDEGSTIC